MTIKEVLFKKIEFSGFKNYFLYASKRLSFIFAEKRTLFDEVKKEKNVSKDIKKILKEKINPLWFSAGEVVTVAILFIIFLLLTHIQSIFPQESFISFIKNLYPFQGSPFALMNRYQNLITIHAGIGALLIGLSFFIAQQIAKAKDSGNSYKGFAFLKRSHFFPILVAEILFFFQFLWGSVNILSIIPIIVIGFFTLVSLYKTIDLIISDFDLKKEEEKIFSDKLRLFFLRTLDLEVTKLVGNGIFKKKVGEFSNFVEFTPFPPINKKDYLKIGTVKEGVIKNIKYKELRFFLSYLQKIAPSEGSELDVNSNSKNTKKEFYLKKPYCYIAPKFFSSVKEVGDVLCWVRKDLVVNKEIEKEIYNKARKIFVIDKADFNLEEARNCVQKLKALCLDLVQAQKTDELVQALSIYTKLIENFYEYLKPFGGGFSEEQASNMRAEIAFGEFKSIEWLAEDMREIFEKGIISPNKEIIREVAYLPIRLLRYSIDYKDHLIFQQFQYYPHRLYQHAYALKKSGNDELANFILDRSWRYLKELADYYLEPKLEDETYPEEEIKKFSVSIFKIFQTLLKSSLDKKDIENFGIYLSSTLGLFRNLSTTTRFGNKKAKKINDYLQEQRQEMLFGLSSWIFFRFEQKKDDNKIEKIFKDIRSKLPSDIIELTQIFLHVHDFDTEDFWGWDNWEMEDKCEGQVHTIQILEKLERLYAVQSLTILASKTDEEICKIDLPTNRDLAFLAEGTRDLVKTLEDIKNNPTSWSFVLSENAISKVDDLKQLLIKARDNQEELDLRMKRETTISNKKIEVFRKGVVRNFYDNHNIRNILKHYGQFEDKSNKIVPKNIKKLGINTLFDKAPFFDDSIHWHISYVGFDEGFDFGRSIAAGENREIILKIGEKLEKNKEKDFESKLLLFGDLSNAIILAVNNASWKFFEQEKRSGEYKPRWQLNNIGMYSQQEIVGIYKINDADIPVYEIYDGTNKTAIFVLRKNKIGTLVQYSPLDEGENKQLQEDHFLIDVQSFDIKSNNELINKFLFKDTPDWLKDVGTPKEQEDYLKERVLIHIFEKFEFKPNESIIGYCVEIDD